MSKKFFSLILLCTPWVTAMSQEREANLKAAFIYNFTKYVEWEAGSGSNDFVIGIIGSSAVTAPLMEIAKTNTVKNKKIVVRVFNKPEDVAACDILFIPQKLPHSLHNILGKAGRGVLTVSEEPGFAKEGTAFNFVVVNEKLKFEANLKAIDAAGLKASSQLLKLAIIINN